ncbi:purine-binding chemotaxis protein CheW [Rhizobium sp. PP-CC-3G-465]|nr:purine-binding chemotaxis protein CheW [Rhizobium sp. PP-CC-3G-465]
MRSTGGAVARSRMSLQVTRSDVSSTWNGQDEMSVLTFNLNGETFAIEATVVQEILDLLPETRVPGAKAFLGGVINFRGKVIPLADIRLAFGMEAGEGTIDSRIIVVQLDIDGEPCLVGIRTDKVYEVTTLSRAASEAPPSVGMRWRAYFIDCLVKRNGEFVIVPNLKTIFASH